jgi:hypothetical protein
MLHADLQFAILAPHDCIPGVISPLLQSNCRGPHAAPSPFPLSLYSPPAAPSDLPLSCSHLETAEAGALPRQRPRILPRGFWRRPHLRSSPARLDLHPHGGGARAGDGRGGGGRAGRRRRRWWPRGLATAEVVAGSGADHLAQHLRGGRLLPFPGHLRLRLLGLRDARGHRRRRAAEEEKVRDSGPTWRRHCCRARSRGGGRDAPRTPLPPPQVYSSDGRKGIRRRRTSSLLRLVRPLRSAMAGANYRGRCRTGWASSAGSCSVCSMGFFSLLSS